MIPMSFKNNVIFEEAIHNKREFHQCKDQASLESFLYVILSISLFITEYILEELQLHFDSFKNKSK